LAAADRDQAIGDAVLVERSMKAVGKAFGAGL
jgi:hypothetical protein